VCFVECSTVNGKMETECHRYIIYINIVLCSNCPFIVMSRDGNAGRGHGVKIHNRSIERVEGFKYLRAMLTDRSSIQEEIKSRLKLGNACYYSVQYLLSSGLLSINLKIKIQVNRTIILPVLYGYETWSLTFREEHRLRVF
jgi:hypothetical protein